MKNFKVILEETHKYKKGSLFVLMFVHENGYGIDVTNATSNFGRVYFDNRDQADYVFNVLNELILDFDDYIQVCEFVSSMLSYDGFNEIVLSIHTSRRMIDKLEMYALINMLNFDKSERHTSSGGHIVRIKLKGSEEMFGEFILISENKKFIFHFL